MRLAAVLANVTAELRKELKELDKDRRVSPTKQAPCLPSVHPLASSDIRRPACSWMYEAPRYSYR